MKVAETSSLTAVRCFDNGYVGKQPVARKEYCAEYWLKELQESMDRCTGRYIRNTVENGVKHHSVYQYNGFSRYKSFSKVVSLSFDFLTSEMSIGRKAVQRKNPYSQTIE